MHLGFMSLDDSEFDAMLAKFDKDATDSIDLPQFCQAIDNHAATHQARLCGHACL